jgi:hypothetical protein
MTYDPYAAADLDSYEPYVGADVGFVLGIEHDAYSLSTSSGAVSTFSITSTYDNKYYPVAMAATIGVDDITVYDDGTAVTVSSFDPATGDIVLAATVAASSVVTCDFTEQFEPYIAQNADISPKYEEKSYYRLRSALKKKMYPSYEITVKLDLLTADFEAVKLAFDSTDGDQLYETPPTVRAYMIADPRTATEETRVLFIPEGRVAFPKLLGGKAGTDFSETSLEITCDERPVVKEFS